MVEQCPRQWLDALNRQRQHTITCTSDEPVHSLTRSLTHSLTHSLTDTLSLSHTHTHMSPVLTMINLVLIITCHSDLIIYYNSSFPRVLYVYTLWKLVHVSLPFSGVCYPWRNGFVSLIHIRILRGTMEIELGQEKFIIRLKISN